MMLSEKKKKHTKLYMQHVYVIHPAMSQLRDLKYVEFKHSQSTHVTHEPTRHPGSSAEMLGPGAGAVSAPPYFLRCYAWLPTALGPLQPSRVCSVST